MFCSWKKRQYTKDAQYLVFEFESVLYVNFGGFNWDVPWCWLNLRFLFVGRISVWCIWDVRPTDHAVHGCYVCAVEDMCIWWYTTYILIHTYMWYVNVIVYKCCFAVLGVQQQYTLCQVLGSSLTILLFQRVSFLLQQVEDVGVVYLTEVFAQFQKSNIQEDGSADLDMVEKVKFLLAGVKMRLRRTPRSGGTISMAQTDLESMRKVLDDGLKTRQKRLVQLRSILQEPIKTGEFSCVGLLRPSNLPASWKYVFSRVAP